MNIHYHKTTGQIMAYDQSEVADLRDSRFPDHSVLFLLALVSINAKTQKIDVLTGELIDKADDEQIHAHLPTLHEVQSAIAHELHHTDSYMVPDRPMADEMRNAWITYRQALRDLSKLPTPTAMVTAWPARPPC